MDALTTLSHLFHAGSAHSQAVGLGGELIGALFLAGLVGGAIHCAGMCGPFVLAQVGARLEANPAATMRELDRLAGGALVPYHLGRMTTYAGLGAAAAFLAGGIVDLSGFRWLSALLLLAAATLLLGHALARLGILRPGRGGGGESRWSRAVSDVARPLFARPAGWRGYALGIALGFIPCGLLYAALAAAAASATPAAGALAMAAFAAGTMPGLVVVGCLGQFVARRWRGVATRWAPALLLLNAGVLVVLAWRWIA